MGAERATVLVVDDDPSLRLLCRVNLELEGYRVLEAGDLAAARSALSGDDVDVILLDVHLGTVERLAGR
jgi:DNA-binding response OmpR family regulator